MLKKYKLRCRVKGIVVTTNPKEYNIVWIREFNPEIYSNDKIKNYESYTKQISENIYNQK
jgi:hypothetical protein